MYVNKVLCSFFTAATEGLHLNTLCQPPSQRHHQHDQHHQIRHSSHCTGNGIAESFYRGKGNLTAPWTRQKINKWNWYWLGVGVGMKYIIFEFEFEIRTQFNGKWLFESLSLFGFFFIYERMYIILLLLFLFMYS